MSDSLDALLVMFLYGAASLYLMWRLVRALWQGAMRWWTRLLGVLVSVVLVPVLLYFLWFWLLPVLFWVVLPLAAVLLAPAVWRHVRTGPQRLALAIAAVPALLWLAWASGGNKLYYDAQVNRLCAKDGGVKVYETVRLPAEKFDQYGQINFYKPTQKENALGEEYLLKTDIQNVRSGNPSLRRYHVQVVRRRDGLLLGESVGYDRGGGDLPGPWQPSSYSCPKHHGEAVIDKVFIADQGVQK